MDVINEALCICCAGGLIVAMAAYAAAMIFFPSTSAYSRRDVGDQPPGGAKDHDIGASHGEW